MVEVDIFAAVESLVYSSRRWNFFLLLFFDLFVVPKRPQYIHLNCHLENNPDTSLLLPLALEEELLARKS